MIFVLEPFFLVCFPPPMTYQVLTFRFSAAVQMKRMSQGFSMQIYVVVSDMFYFNLFFWKDDPIWSIWLSFNWFEQRWNDEMINHKDTIRIIIGLALHFYHLPPQVLSSTTRAATMSQVSTLSSAAPSTTSVDGSVRVPNDRNISAQLKCAVLSEIQEHVFFSKRQTNRCALCIF